MAQLRSGTSLGSCGNCGYASAGTPMRCLKEPPVPEGSTGRGVFPAVDDGDWCGDWASPGTVNRIITERERGVEDRE